MSSPSRSSFPTLGDLRRTASSFFSATTGPSRRIQRHYETLSPSYLSQPMTPDNVGDFVRRENRAVFQGTTPPTRQDYLAMAATPFRSTFAHFAAQQMVVSRMGHFHDNEYSRSALEGVIG